jgi:DNA-binding MarR family transcriptional regulator
MTKSIKILADKYDVSPSTMRHIVGDELLSEVKLNPSNLQDKVLRLMREGNGQSDIARLLKMSRQAVFIAVTEAKKKGLVK